MRDLLPTTARPDVSILGAGIIGLSLALELKARGHRTEVLDPSPPLSQASTAAAGMLAVEDPHNPPQLLPFSRLSGSLYAAFLARVKDLSGLEVPLQTEVTWQSMPDGSVRRLLEHSLDPRQLAPALLAATQALDIGVTRVAHGTAHERAQAGTGAVIHTTGAWGVSGLPLSPRKGQMLRVRLPSASRLREVYRSESVYVVPRTQGPQAGTALIGATVENAGFDLSTVPADLQALRRLGATLVGELGDERAAPMVESWAGLRPATPDHLPILGAFSPHGLSPGGARHFVAAGHFRNGILLAPATAVVLADLVEARSPSLDLTPFAPQRFQEAVS